MLIYGCDGDYTPELSVLLCALPYRNHTAKIQPEPCGLQVKSVK